jgi:hypothetical protein
MPVPAKGDAGIAPTHSQPQHHAPAALTPGKTQYPFYRRLGGLWDQSERAHIISPPQGFDPWTVQPVVSSYIDYSLHHSLCSVVCGRTLYAVAWKYTTRAPLPKAASTHKESALDTKKPTDLAFLPYQPQSAGCLPNIKSILSTFQ